MDLGIIEVVVNRRKMPLMEVGKIVLIIIAALSILNGVTLLISSLVMALVFLVIGAAAGVGAYMVFMNCVVDYEYSLVDRELRVAKIMNKEKRKSLGEYDLDKMEILAPMNSHQLDSYRGRQDVKKLDYSTQDKAREKTTYHLYLGGGQCLILDLDPDTGEGRKMLEGIRSFAPRKVFTD